MTETTHHWEDGPDSGTYNWQDLQPKLMDIGDRKSFAFEITRTRDDGLSFSAEAVEGLARGVMSFFLSRCHYEYKERGIMATRARIIITVDLD